jgi:hypothetical protein
VQGKDIHNIFIKITENFQNFEKKCSFRYRKYPGHQIDMTENEPPYGIL